MRNKWRRKLRCFGTFVLMLSCLCFHRTISAYASPAERETIQIDVKVEDKKDNRVGIENVKFLLYHIADWETDRWVLEPNFADFTGKLDFSDAKEQEKTSRELSEYIRKKAFREIMGTSNASGIVMFTNLEQGIYLVAQEQSFRYDIYTYTSTPSLVQVPARIGDQDYLNVELEMKFARMEDKPDRPSSSHKQPTPDTIKDDSGNQEELDDSTNQEELDDSTNQEELETTGLVETKPEETIPILVVPKTGDMAKPGIYLAGTILSLAAILLLLYLIPRRKE